jgi:GDPmannose 4,6-dehydratase
MASVKRAFVTGAGGQDGYYLTRLLLERGDEVVGCGRPQSLAGPRGDQLRRIGVRIVEVDLLDRESTRRAVEEIAPDDIYNLAGHSFVPASWDDPAAAIRITSWPVINLLEAVRGSRRPARFYQSSTSEIFGLARTSPQDEETPVAPANPYAAAKVFAHQVVSLYREHYGLFATSGILYNHESPQRPLQFVTRKVTRAACRIKLGQEHELVLGDLDVMRDWGFAGDYVDAMRRMLHADAPQDFVIGTGVPHTVGDLCRVAFEAVGLDFAAYVKSDPSLRRPGQPTHLLANPARAERVLGWKATTSFRDLIHCMVEADMRLCRSMEGGREREAIG